VLVLPTFDELRDYVHGVLCMRADLEDSTPLFDATLYRQNRPCGIEYLLLAPRSIRLSAIWDAVTQRVLFYDAELTRFQTTPIQGPEVSGIESRPRSAIHLRSMWKGK
jgi:hypothetical protein